LVVLVFVLVSVGEVEVEVEVEVRQGNADGTPTGGVTHFPPRKK
jgi:hypothetical protein